jgi:hypothetical protein
MNTIQAPKIMMKRQKRSFLLIEILIAITLISLCGFALLAPSYTITQKKIERIESLQLNHFSKERYLRLKMLILEGAILLPREESSLSGSLPPIEIITGLGKKKLFNCSYLIRKENSTKKESSIRAYLFNITFTFKNEGGHTFYFSHPLYVEEMRA